MLCYVAFFFLDLKVDVHRKNSSESGEEVATLRPVVERVSVHRAEQCTQADHERYRTKLQGNSSCFVEVIHLNLGLEVGTLTLGFDGLPQSLLKITELYLKILPSTSFPMNHSEILLLFDTA